jgi:SPP1 gp7 family putative phage head morphogenesis protein
LGGNAGLQKLAAAVSHWQRFGEALLPSDPPTYVPGLGGPTLTEYLQAGQNWNEVEGDWGAFNLRDPKLLDELKQSGKLITGTVTQTMMEDLHSVLEDQFFRQGQPLATVIEGMKGIFPETYANRHENIARTEVTKAISNYQLKQMADCEGVDKQWFAFRDEHTRPSHLFLDGQVQPVDKPFVTEAGVEVMAPGDGPPSEACNCRCDMLPVIDGDSELPASPWTGEEKAV